MKTPLQLMNVLVCEYKPYNHAVLRQTLEQHGHSVTMTTSLTEALKIFANNPVNTFDLLLVDVIPSEHGMEWVNTVRHAQPFILLLAMSAYLGDGFLPPGCDLYLTKPFTSQDLADGVAQLLDSRGCRGIPAAQPSRMLLQAA